MVTDLTITGRVAQFGRGVLADVSAKLLDQFVENLETTGARSTTTRRAPDRGEPPSRPLDGGLVPDGPRRIDHPEPEPVDLIDAAGTPVARRVAPVLAVIAILWVLKKLLSRSKD